MDDRRPHSTPASRTWRVPSRDEEISIGHGSGLAQEEVTFNNEWCRTQEAQTKYIVDALNHIQDEHRKQHARHCQQITELQSAVRTMRLAQNDLDRRLQAHLTWLHDEKGDKNLYELHERIVKVEKNVGRCKSDLDVICDRSPSHDIDSPVNSPPVSPPRHRSSQAICANR